MKIAQKVYIKNAQDEILALFRGKNAPTRPSTWDLPGGIFDDGETPEESILREIKEETDLKVKNLRTEMAVNFMGEENVEWFVVIYSAEIDGDETPTLSYEHDEYKWVSQQQFKRMAPKEPYSKIKIL